MAALQQQRGDQPFVTRQRIIAVQHRSHAVCQLVATIQPAPTRDPVRESLGQQEGNLIAVRRTSPAIQAFAQLLRPLLPVPLVARKRLTQIAAATARRLLKNSRQFCRRGNFIIPLRGHQHRGQTRIVAQRRHFLAARRQTLAFQRAKLRQQRARSGEVYDRRRIKPGELLRVRAAPLEQIHHQTRQIAL